MKRIGSLEELNRIVQKPDYKKVGNWMARNVTRDMALPLTRLFLHTPITANQVTFLSFVSALAGCAFLALGGKVGVLVGAFLIQLWYLLDHVDGQVARYRNQSSLTGIYFDYVIHYVVHAGIFFGIGAGVYLKTGNAIYMAVGGAAGTAVILLNLVYDVQYKAFFHRIVKAEHIRIKSDKGEKGTGSSSEGDIIRKGFSYLHKICEVHVVMNLITLLAIIGLFTGVRIWEYFMLFYMFVTVFTAVVKNTYFVFFRVPDTTFDAEIEVIR